MVRERVWTLPTERVSRRATLVLLPVVLALLGLWLLRDLWPPFRSVVVLFFLGWLLAFLLDPPVSGLVRRVPAVSRGPATAIVAVLIAVAVLFIGAAVGISFLGSAGDLATDGPAIEEDIARALAPLRDVAGSLGIEVDTRALAADLHARAREELGGAVEAALPASLGLVGSGLIIVFTGTVMVANKHDVLLFTRRLVSPRHLPLFDRFSAEVVRSFGGFVRGQFGLAFLYGLAVALLAVALGIPFAPVVGVTTLLLQSIPWFGQLVSWVPLVVVTLLFRPELLVPVLVVMLVCWLAFQNLIAPRLLGSAVGLHPLAVLAAVLIGGALAGPLGAVFGVPVAAAFAAVFLAWLDVVRPARSVPARRPRPRRRGRRRPAVPVPTH